MEYSNYSHLEIDEQIKFFNDVQNYLNIFIKKKLKKNYSKINQIIAQEILCNFGWSLSNYNEIESKWPENMQTLIDKIEIIPDIKIKLVCIPYEHLQVYIFYKLEVLEKIKYKLKTEVLLKEDGNTNEWFFPIEIMKKFKQIEDKYNLNKIDWLEKLKESEIVFYD